MHLPINETKDALAFPMIIERLLKLYFFFQ